MDEVQFARLYIKERKRVYLFMLSGVGNEATAEDLTQETFIRVWRQRHHLDADRAPGYVTITMRSVLVDHFRHFGWLRELPLEVPAGEGDEGEWTTVEIPVPPSQLSDIEAQELQEQIDKALGRLSGQQRLIVTLRLEGVTNPTIAALLKSTPSNVASVWHRALRAVAKDVNELQTRRSNREDRN
jgi:RNA polymerase sigma-70 factor (ECF subfamily)